MTIPFLFLLGGLLGVLAYFARRNITWDKRPSTGGSIGMAFIVFIFAGIIIYAIDVWIGWSIIPQYMMAAGGALQVIALLFFAGFALLCISMLVSASKCGTMVA